jgi:hypothetical protein
MQVRFYVDPDTGLPHIYNHDVDEEEVLDILEGPSLRVHGKQGSFLALGQTRAGRYLKVIYRIDADGGIFVITGYDLHGKALKAYRRRRRRKGQ